VKIDTLEKTLKPVRHAGDRGDVTRAAPCEAAICVTNTVTGPIWRYRVHRVSALDTGKPERYP
jgi:hypothetical protein